jgi:ABC-type uncharacterized transport system substrate-binding protein
MEFLRRRRLLLGSATVAWPLAARAQQAERMRRIGVLLPGAADDAEFQARMGAFLQALALLGWTIGRNVRIDTRWATTNAADIRRHAAELAALAPDVILAYGSSTVGPLLQATRTVPIVFANPADLRNSPCRFCPPTCRKSSRPTWPQGVPRNRQDRMMSHYPSFSTPQLARRWS